MVHRKGESWYQALVDLGIDRLITGREVGRSLSIMSQKEEQLQVLGRHPNDPESCVCAAADRRVYLDQALYDPLGPHPSPGTLP